MRESGGRAGLIKEISDEIRRNVGGAGYESDEEIRRLIEEYVFHSPRTQRMNFKDKISVVNGVFNSMRKELDLLQPYMEDPEINEIMVNGRDHIFVERKGELFRIDEAFPSDEALEEVIMRIAGKVHREINEMNPILDARLSDGSRVHAVYKKYISDGSGSDHSTFSGKPHYDGGSDTIRVRDAGSCGFSGNTREKRI